MNRKVVILSIVLFGLVVFAGCKPNANMANPASVFCEENNGKLEIRTDDEGGQVGFCIFEDGSECEEWAFYNGECQPGDSLAPNAELANPASVFCEENDGKLEIRTDENGNQIGYCLFEDGSECEEWAFFRGECEVGEFYPVED